MNRLLSRLAGLMLTGILLFAVSGQRASAQDVTVSYQDFYDELAPYGQWVYDAEYGNVWVPNEEAGYRPYATRGQWVMTEYGNMWVSDAPWGWACYHYGRWTFNYYYGWVWIPGYEWAPAWVSWRSGNGYYGWAPMGPGYVTGRRYDYPENYWVFVGPEYLYHPNVYSYYEPRNSRWFMRRTTYINEVYEDRHSHHSYYYGPRREEIERHTHQPVQVYQVSNASRSHETRLAGNNVSIYRPAVNRENERTARPANLIRASQPVGKPQGYVERSGDRQPEFRSVMQKQNPNFRSPNNYGGTGIRQQEPQNNPRQKNDPGNRYDNRNEPGGRPRQQTEQPHPQMEQPRPQPQPQPQPRPQFDQPRPQPQPQPRPQMEQPRPQPQPQPRPQMEQPRPQPQPQPRPQMEQPRPQPQPRPQMEQPRPQPQPRPQMEQPRPQPQPRPQMEQPRPQPQPRPQMEQPRPQPQPRPQMEQPRPQPQPQNRPQPQPRPQPHADEHERRR